MHINKVFTKNQEPASLEQALADIQNLMWEHRPVSALDELNKLIEQGHDSVEVLHQMGEALYRMQDFAEAQAQFESTFQQYPDHYESLQRKWAASLANDRSEINKLKVRSEIERLAEQIPNNPAALFAAYKGYTYLWEREPRVPLIERLVPMTSDHELSAAVAAHLLEEMISARDTAEKTRLALLYVETYPEQRGFRLASQNLVRLHQDEISGDQLAVRQYLGRFSDNRHVKQMTAAFLVFQNKHLDLARNLLQQHLQMWRAESENEQARYTDEAAWRTISRWERAESLYLFGTIAFHERHLERAQTLFLFALNHHARPGVVYQALYEVTRETNNENAFDYLLQALQHGQNDPRLHDDLIIYLGDSVSLEDARKLLADQRDIVTFVDVSKQMSLGNIAASRVAWGDYDNDGYDDLLLSGPRVFKNVSGTHFQDSTADLGLSESEKSTGGLWADVDNDGDLDLFLTFPGQNKLFENRNGKSFTNITSSAFESPSSSRKTFQGRTEAATFGDMDGDGWLDLYLANYEGRGAERGVCFADQLFRNNEGKFIEVTEQANAINEAPLCGRGATWSDVNGDGRQDILVSNYRLDPNTFWINKGRSGFEDQAAQWGLRGDNAQGAFGHTIGSVVGDIDNNGLLDVYMSNLSHPRYLDYSDVSGLFLRAHRRTKSFENIWNASGIAFEETSSDPALADIDNDGDLDLFVTSVYEGRTSHLYRNDGNGKFMDISWLSGAQVDNGWGAAFSDMDNDGDVDLVVAHHYGVSVLRNSGNSNNWLQVNVRSEVCNRFGVGSRVQISYAGQSQIREIIAGRGTGSQDSLTAHFGLGGYDGLVKVKVKDLCGGKTSQKIEQLNRKVTIKAE